MIKDFEDKLRIIHEQNMKDVDNLEKISQKQK